MNTYTGGVTLRIPTFSLKKKVALVTGGSKGIGYGMAVGLGAYGATVIIASRGEEDLRKAEQGLKDRGIKAKGYRLDVTKKDQVEQLINNIVTEFGSLDILINNAGMNIRKPLTDIEEKTGIRYYQRI